jgi:hypothetical protein
MNEEIRGNLSIYALVGFVPLNGNQRNKIKPVVVEVHRDVTKSQAKGLMMDFQGQNQGQSFHGEWVARHSFF